MIGLYVPALTGAAHKAFCAKDDPAATQGGGGMATDGIIGILRQVYALRGARVGSGG